MTRYLLDTDICIYLIKQHPPEVISRFRQIRLQQLHISSISVFELYYGVQNSQLRQKNSSALESFITPLSIVEFDLESAKMAAVIRHQLQQAGTPIGAYDLQIAGIALAQGMTLLTNNVREFSRVKGLELENWVS